MLVASPFLLTGHREEAPGLGEVRSGPRVSQASAGVEDQLGLSVAGDISEAGGFIVDCRMHQVFLPLPIGFTPGVFKPVHRLAGPFIDQDVVIAIGVDVVDHGDEVVGVAGGLEGLDGIERVLVLEVRALVPMGSVDGVHFSVLVEVTVARAFSVEGLGQDDLFEGAYFVGFIGRQGACNETQKDGGEQEGLVDHFVLPGQVHGGFHTRVPFAAHHTETRPRSPAIFNRMGCQRTGY